MPKHTFSLGVIAVLVIAVLAFGTVMTLDRTAKNQTPTITTFSECASAGYPILASYPRQCKTPNGQTFTETTPTPTSDVSDLIRVTSPAAYETLSSPFTVIGEARGSWYFEGSFPIKLLAENGSVLATTTGAATGEWMTNDFTPFRATISFVAARAGATGTLVLQNDNPSGKPELARELRIPVKFATVSAKTMDVKAYFVHIAPGENYDCETVVPVTRTITRTSTPARAALEELLKGPTQAEKDRGFTTQINAGVRVNSLTITNGTAKVDFSNRLEEAVGGSCRTNVIRRQIETTLLQFPSIQRVEITIEGRGGDLILQP